MCEIKGGYGRCSGGVGGGVRFNPVTSDDSGPVWTGDAALMRDVFTGTGGVAGGGGRSAG